MRQMSLSLLVRAASSAETKTAVRFSEAAALLSADCIGQMGQMYLSLLDGGKRLLALMRQLWRLR